MSRRIRWAAALGLAAVAVVAPGAALAGVWPSRFLLVCAYLLALFLVAGNILARFQTKTIDQVRGLRRAAPWSGSITRGR